MINKKTKHSKHYSSQATNFTQYCSDGSTQVLYPNFTLHVYSITVIKDMVLQELQVCLSFPLKAHNQEKTKIHYDCLKNKENSMIELKLF